MSLCPDFKPEKDCLWPVNSFIKTVFSLVSDGLLSKPRFAFTLSLLLSCLQCDKVLKKCTLNTQN